MANPRRTASIRPSGTSIEASPGPPIPHYAIPLDRPVLYRFSPGDTSTVNHTTVLGCTGGVLGRWLQVGGYLPAITATSTGAAGVTASLVVADNESYQVHVQITGRCTIGADAGAVWAATYDGAVKRGVGVATIVRVGVDVIGYWRDAGGYSALTLTVTPNAATGNLDLVLPGVAAETMVFGLIALCAKSPSP